ncbi:MAG: tripartite tricarboxylate transporter substrate binding protein, partial [Betaproteobacteria bacterium]|nr:tripartite tricarboxylate transporter substrate binding protein [Betaproteobacteria bacterium]
RLVVPLPPGSGSDLLARAFAQRLTMQWGQSVVVENRPGASTIVANEAVARAAPDGHTLVFAIDGGFTVNPHLYAKLPYHPIKDFAPITLITIFGTLLVANPSLPANSVPELIALAKAQPGKVSYGSIGSGSQMHLLSAMLGHKAGIEILHVPYKGIPQMMTAVLTGEVQLSWVGVFSARPLVRAGRLKALGFGGAKRAAMMPEVPTLAELGYPEVEASVWYGLLAPRATPRLIIERIHADVLKLLRDPEFRDKEMLSKGYEPSGLGPEEFAALIVRETAARGVMVKISGARAE